MEALRQGKLVHEAGMKIVVGEREWKFVMNGANWAFSGVKAPALLQDEEDDRLIERFWLLEELHKIVENLYATFLEAHLDSLVWGKKLQEIRAWLRPG